jgi:hypothetical protein
MIIEIPDDAIKLIIREVAIKIINDLSRYDGVSKKMIDDNTKKAFHNVISTIDIEKIVSDKIDFVLNDAADSFLKKKGREAIKKAFNELTASENDLIDREKTDQIEMKIDWMNEE